MVFLIVVQFFGYKNNKNRANGSFFLNFAENYRIMLIVNIKELVGIEEQGRLLKRGKEMAETGRIKNAFLLIKGKRIADYGPMDSDACRKYLAENQRVHDVKGSVVMPAFCDSHTHLVYANSREMEFVDKIRGLSYEEIAKRGGGILNSAKATAAASEDELYDMAQQRLDEVMRMGTGAIEIKSGYGLTTESELKLLRVIRRLKENSPLTIRSNFLGAHGIPMEYRGHQEDYVDLVINEMIPLVAAEDLADFIDVFCDQGFFTVEDTERILMAGIKYGMRPKIHANEMAISGGVQVGVKYGAISVDHLEQMGDEEIECLKDSETMPTILPGCAFFLNLPLSPAKDDRSWAARGHGLRFQPWHFAFGQHAAHPLNGLHPLPPDT
jgi:imidazolonepropionase